MARWLGFRPLATITHNTLAWYGRDDDGAGASAYFIRHYWYCYQQCPNLARSISFNFCVFAHLNRIDKRAGDLRR